MKGFKKILLKSFGYSVCVGISCLSLGALEVNASEILNGAGLCLDTHVPDIARNGGKVQVWECNGTRQQT